MSPALRQRDPIMLPSYRDVCYRCRRARLVCLCDVIRPVAAAAEIAFLQHPREARNVVGTVHLAHLALPDSRVFKGIDFSADLQVQAHLRSRPRSVVLYPAKDALPAEALAEREGPLTLWVIDGTWSQARKMWNANPWLQALPAYRLTPEAPGNYRIRREPAAHCLATIEAVAAVLDVIAKEKGKHAALLEAFTTMVDRQLGFVGVGGGRKRQKKVVKPRVVRFPQGFDASDLVLLHAEGNGWPSTAPEHRLLELRMYRPSTGESSCLHLGSDVAPNPVAMRELDLHAPRWVDPTELADRVRAFIGSAWALGWGQYPPKLLAPYLPLARYVDFKPLLVDYHRKRLGYVDDALCRLGLASRSAHRSRGERRMLALIDVLRATLTSNHHDARP